MLLIKSQSSDVFRRKTVANKTKAAAGGNILMSSGKKKVQNNFRIVSIHVF